MFSSAYSQRNRQNTLLKRQISTLRNSCALAPCIQAVRRSKSAFNKAALKPVFSTQLNLNLLQKSI